MTDRTRSIETAIEVAGTPEEVWAAIATGTGISSWYVPHEVEERIDGATVASFGPGMDVVGRVSAWDPPRRVVFDGGDGVDGLAFEWTVEERAGGTCVVRLVNNGFGSGSDWDDQYDAMVDGWRLFMINLKLHLGHFRGRTATAMLPMATWPVSPGEAWARLTQHLGVGAQPVVGDAVDISLADGLRLAGTIADVSDHSVSLVLDEPSEGTAFVAAEGSRDETSVSIWSYLYGDRQRELVERDTPRWATWLAAIAPTSSTR